MQAKRVLGGDTQRWAQARLSKAEAASTRIDVERHLVDVVLVRMQVRPREGRCVHEETPFAKEGARLIRRHPISPGVARVTNWQWLHDEPELRQRLQFFSL